MKNYLLLALAAVALLFAGCKKNDPGADKPKVVAVTGVSLNTNAVALEVDDSVTLTATVAPANATNKGVEWSVADDAIATVKNGVVKAVAIGETTVTVTTVDGGFTASATITVAESIIKVTGVTLDKPGLELEIGDSDTLTATVAPDDATNKAVSWSSANDAIATVEDGVVTAVAAGETTVTVTTADGAFKATANVVVKAAPIKVTGVSLDKTMVALEIDESVTIEATVTPENATNKAVEWSIADTAVATVSNGVVTGVAVGETTLTATTADGGFTATIPVKVVAERVPVEEISMIYPLVIKEGQEGEITIGFSPINATNTNATITLSAPDVLSVEYKGNNQNPMLPSSWPCYTVKGLKAGKCNIKAVSEDGGFEYESTVTVVEDTTVKVTEIKIGPENAIIEVGETTQFAAAISPSDAYNKEVEWSSSDTSVATVKAISNNYIAEFTGVGKGTATITATAKDGSGVKGEATITVVDKKPTSITFDGTAPYEFYYWQGKVIDFKNDLKMKVEPADADLSVIEWGISIQSARDDVSGEEVKYEIKDDNITLSYAHSTHWVAAETVHATAYVDNVEIGSVSIIMQNRGILFYSSTGLSYYYDLAMQGNKMNWNNDNITKLKYICYNKLVGTGSIPSYDKYQIPSSEYTLTSSDESKIKVTKNDDDISWLVERLNTTDLVAVTLTYKCGEHTQTYTINLIP